MFGVAKRYTNPPNASHGRGRRGNPQSPTRQRRVLLFYWISAKPVAAAAAASQDRRGKQESREHECGFTQDSYNLGFVVFAAEGKPMGKSRGIHHPLSFERHKASERKICVLNTKLILEQEHSRCCRSTEGVRCPARVVSSVMNKI